jgi:type II secretory pathway component PulJ
MDGSTLIEVLIAMMLLGIVGMATLSMMGTTLRSSFINRGLAKSFSDLSSAAAYISDPATSAPSCSLGETAVKAHYQSVINTGSGRSGRVNLAIVRSVKFWNGSDFGSSCAPGYRLQQISIEVASATGTPVRLAITKRPAAGVVAL